MTRAPCAARSFPTNGPGKRIEQSRITRPLRGPRAPGFRGLEELRVVLAAFREDIRGDVLAVTRTDIGEEKADLHALEARLGRKRARMADLGVAVDHLAADFER